MKIAETYAPEYISVTNCTVCAFIGAPVFDTTRALLRHTNQSPLRCKPLHIPQEFNACISRRVTHTQSLSRSRMSTIPIEERRQKATQLKRRVRALTSPIPYLSSSRFNELREEGSPLLVIDAREPEEVSVSTIPSAVPVSRADEHIDQLRRMHGNDFSIVCFCTIGFRSGLYAKGLRAAPKNVYNYSLMEHLWGNGTLISSRDEGQTRVHLYSRHYENYFPDKYPVETFGAMTALFRGLGHLPSLLSVATGKRVQLEDEPIGS